MTLIAAAIFTKSGKCLLSRQFLSGMTRSRLESLLDAFPKLVKSEKNQHQHTFFETESVRYVYQVFDKLYIVLITTTNSNILSDLETLRLFSKIAQDYCPLDTELEIFKNAFELIFAFDEVVALGYREGVNLAQIRTFTKMDSREERIFNQNRIGKELAAKREMKKKVIEIEREAKKKKAMDATFQKHYLYDPCKKQSFDPGASFSQARETLDAFSDFYSTLDELTSSDANIKSKIGGGGKAMKLGRKSSTTDVFYEQLRQEGQQIEEFGSNAKKENQD